MNLDSRSFSTTNLQHGFKKIHGTTQRSFVVNEIIQYHLHNDTMVNVPYCAITCKATKYNHMQPYATICNWCSRTKFPIQAHTTIKLETSWTDDTPPFLVIVSCYILCNSIYRSCQHIDVIYGKLLSCCFSYITISEFCNAVIQFNT